MTPAGAQASLMGGTLLPDGGVLLVGREGTLLESRDRGNSFTARKARGRQGARRGVAAAVRRAACWSARAARPAWTRAASAAAPERTDERSMAWNKSDFHAWSRRIAQPMLRRVLLAVFVLLTALLVWSATQLKVDAGFSKMVPLEHEYMRTFTEYQKTFGGANRVLVALRVKGAGGDIYTPEFMRALKGATDDVFFIPGVDRATVTSLFTPNVRFIEVVEEGFAGGNVVPATFRGTPADLEIVRQNVLKSGNVGRLVANDFRGALIRAELLEVDPASGQRLNYRAVAKQLEAVRAKYQSDQIDVHIIGFAKAVGDITDGAIGVLAFFAIAFVITAILLYLYKGSLSLTVLALVCALMPVVWLLGLLPILGYGIDPMSILVPFLIFSIGVSHAVQMTNVWQQETQQGHDGRTAALNAFLKLFIPGSVALITNALGFLVIMHIKIDVVRELGITASLGVALMILTNKILLPVLLSYLPAPRRRRRSRRSAASTRLWRAISAFAEPRVARGDAAGRRALARRRQLEGARPQDRRPRQGHPRAA